MQRAHASVEEERERTDDDKQRATVADVECLAMKCQAALLSAGHSSDVDVVKSDCQQGRSPPKVNPTFSREGTVFDLQSRREHS